MRQAPNLAARRFAVPTALGIVAIALLAAVPLLSGRLSNAPAAQGVANPQQTATEAPTLETTEPPALDALQTQVSSYEVFLARDPFEPVIPDADPTGDGGTGTPGSPTGDGTVAPDSPDGTPTTSPTTAPTTTPTVPSDGSPDQPGDGDSSDPDCMTTETVTCDGHVVSLVDVFTRDGTNTASVRIDTTVYEVVADQVFADNFRVMSIEPPCVTLQFGDDSFTLCEGESVLK